MAQQSLKQHLWLSQVEISGIVFSEPVLADSVPAGFIQLEKQEVAKFRIAHERWKLPKNMVQGDPHKDWIEHIIENILRLDKSCRIVNFTFRSIFVIYYFLLFFISNQVIF